MILPKILKVLINNNHSDFYTDPTNYAGYYFLMPTKYNNLPWYRMSKNGLSFIIYQGSRYLGDDIIIRTDQKDTDIFWIFDCSRCYEPEFGNIPDYVSCEANKCLPTNLEYKNYMGKKVNSFKIKAIL